MREGVAFEEGHKDFSQPVVAYQFAVGLAADGKDALAVAAGKRLVKVQGTRGELHRIAIGTVPPVGFLFQRPEVGDPPAARPEDKVAAVRRPLATAFCGIARPVEPQFAKVAAIRTNLP